MSRSSKWVKHTFIFRSDAEDFQWRMQQKGVKTLFFIDYEEFVVSVLR